MARLVGTRTQTSVRSIPTLDCGQSGAQAGSSDWLMNAYAAGNLNGGGVGNGPLDCAYRKEINGGLFKMVASHWLGKWDSQTGPKHHNYNYKFLSKIWDDFTDRNTNTEDQAGFLSQQKHINRAGARGSLPTLVCMTRMSFKT